MGLPVTSAAEGCANKFDVMFAIDWEYALQGYCSASVHCLVKPSCSILSLSLMIHLFLMYTIRTSLEKQRFLGLTVEQAPLSIQVVPISKMIQVKHLQAPPLQGSLSPKVKLTLHSTCQGAVRAAAP